MRIATGNITRHLLNLGLHQLFPYSFLDGIQCEFSDLEVVIKIRALPLLVVTGQLFSSAANEDFIQGFQRGQQGEQAVFPGQLNNVAIILLANDRFAEAAAHGVVF